MASSVRHCNMTGAVNLEMQDIGPNQPSRQLTLEAQDHTPRASHAAEGFLHTWRKALSIKSAPRRIRDHESDLEAASKLHPECPQFWDDYLHLRDRPRAPIECFFHLIVKKIVQPSNHLETIEDRPKHKTCLSDWLESIHEALFVESSDSLILW